MTEKPRPASADMTLVRRKQIVDALRRGTVPRHGLELFAVGLERFETAIDEGLKKAARGQGEFKAVRGEYGTGKTFFSRWLEHRALKAGFASAVVQINASDTPLHKMETVYRRAIENLRTQDAAENAFLPLIEGWFYGLEEEALAQPGVDEANPESITRAVGELLESKLRDVSATQPQFAAALRALHAARAAGDHRVADGLLAWLMGQPGVAAGIKARAGLKGDLDHFGAMGFLRGLLSLLQQTGRKGLLLVLDEVETIQRVPTNVREKSLNAIRQLLDELEENRYPGLYVLMTGTPQFFDGQQGVQRAPALAQRLHTRFRDDPTHDNPRAVQIRLLPFSMEKLQAVGCRVRDIYPSEHAERLAAKANDEFIARLAEEVSGAFGKKVGIAPRIFLKTLVDELDTVDAHADYDPTAHFKFSLDPTALTASEKEAAGLVSSVDDIQLDLDMGGAKTGEGAL
jgi:hypothetical protein